MIEFLDTDCPYCFNEAREYQEASQYFTPENPNWDGPHISFIASAAELTGLKGHESSREEIMAFRDKTSGEMCNAGNQDCSTRDGAPYLIPFVDDLDKSNFSKYLIDYHILPMVAAIWSMPLNKARDMPLELYLNFFQ